MTRPKAVAPPGFVTLQEAADLAGVSRSAAYRQLRVHNIAHVIERDAIFIPEEHVALIEPRRPADDNRKAVMCRIPLEVYAAFERAAGKRGLPVSSWLIQLGKKASGWKDDEKEGNAMERAARAAWRQRRKDDK